MARGTRITISSAAPQRLAIYARMAKLPRWIVTNEAVMWRVFIAAATLACITTTAIRAQSTSAEAIKVTPDNFVRAETDLYFGGTRRVCPIDCRL